MPLGLGFGDFSETTVSIPPGARAVLYSDGITEAASPTGEEYSAERLQEHAQRAEACSESIVSDVRAFANGAALRDDATVIFVRALD